MDERKVLKIIEQAAKDGRTELDLSGEGLTSVPAEIGSLANLTRLTLHYNQLTSVPAEIGNLANLQILRLDKNQLTSVPAEIGNLANLTTLVLGNNQLTSIPAEIGNLANLTWLSLSNNQLTSVPAEIGNLANLTRLDLDNNQLTSVPAEIGNLAKLIWLGLHENQLTSVPAEIGKLTKLETLYLDGNAQLSSPPPEVVQQGRKAILAYLRGQLKESKRQWVSKLLVVGEGGVGKTSLLRALRAEPFIESLETTHGIGIEKLELTNLEQTDVTMRLNTWDFGGQQIYHATHQFFLTKRSLYVLVWDARHGWEAGKLYYWLDMIQASAPDSPVLIVAAHIDERDADLPLDKIRSEYKQVVGHYEVSNVEGTGIEELRSAIAEAAGKLPLMGEEWPANWLDAANAIRDRKEHYVSPKKLYELMARHEVKEKSAEVLAQWLHELGDILYFKEDEELNELVVLDAQWVTESISKVLESKDVIKRDGIFSRRHMDELWRDIEKGFRDYMLDLMERFDLSYKIPEHEDISLVVERLPLDPPDYKPEWDEIKNKNGCKEISMKFELSSVPAGIPTWFIARSHRFTTHTHWRMGALFADGKEKRHLGLIEAYPHDRFVRLTVRGPVPYNFFVLLRDGLELTLARFPGLKIKRTMPCPGHNNERCVYEFDFENLQRALEKGLHEIQCQVTFKSVFVPGLLFGLHWSTEDAVMEWIDVLSDQMAGVQYEVITCNNDLQEGFRTRS